MLERLHVSVQGYGMVHSSRAAWGLAASLACVAVAALQAHAQERLEVTDDDDLQCVSMESCTLPSDSCPEGTSCQTLPSDLLRCSAGETGARCCADNQDCTSLLGSDGACDIQVLGSENNQTICSSPDGVTAERYCSDTDEVDVAQFEQCHTTPGGIWTADWLEGDCDQDGSPNGEDAAPCSDAIVGGDAGVDAGADGGAPDAGTGMDAGAHPPDDAGSTTRDASVDASVDAAADAATAMDAGGKDATAGTGGKGGMGGTGGAGGMMAGGTGGAGGMMAGGSGGEAGAAGSGADAATDPGGLTFRGGGGCSCRAPGGGEPHGAWAWVSLLGLAWLRWRRRAR